MRQVKRIAVLRALKLGDLLCAVPAFRALRAAHPFAEIRLIGLPWAAELVRQLDSYLDGLCVLPGFPGMPEAPFDARAFTRFLADVQDWGPDLVLQMHGSGDLSNPLTLLLGGQTTAGFYRPGQLCPDPDRFIPYPDDLPEIGRHLRLLEHLGMPAVGEYKELPVFDADRRELAALRSVVGLTRPYAVIHPGASVPERQWPPERFAAVADWLIGQGLHVVLTGGPAEAGIVQAVCERMAQRCTSLAGRTRLGALAELLADAALLVSNDTGVMHVGEAVGTPLVAVSFDPEAWRWSPLDTIRHRVLPGGLAVSVGDVLEVVQQRLGDCTAASPGRPPAAGQMSDGAQAASERR